MNENDDPTLEFDFANHSLQAIQEYQRIRPLYEEYANVIKNVLSEAFKAQRIKIHSIEARAKTLDNFGNKA